MPVPHASEYYGDPCEQLQPVEVTVGRITMWFARTGYLVAFALADGGLVCLDDEEDGNEVATETMDDKRRVPGQRLARHLPPAEFERAWEAATDAYLYPDPDRIVREWPDLAPDIPLAVLADWLQDHGLDEAAKVLRSQQLQEG